MAAQGASAFRRIRKGIRAALGDRRVEALVNFRATLALRVVNSVFQRILRLNGNVPWQVHFTSRVTCPERIGIHPSVRASFGMSPCCYVQAGNGIRIGEGSMFGPGVKIISADHDREHLDRHLPGPPIIIGRHCWIGANAVILPGTVLEDSVTVAAGSVVRGCVRTGTTVAGVPARVVRER